MTESRTYLLNNVDIQIVIDELSRFLHTEKGMDVQTAPTPDGYLLQAGQPKDTLRTLSGMRLATTVQFSIVENNLNVTIGEDMLQKFDPAGSLAAHCGHVSISLTEKII